VKSLLVKNREILISYFQNQNTKSKEESQMKGSLELIYQIQELQIEE